MGGSRGKNRSRILTFRLDALPLVNHFLDRLQLRKFLLAFLPQSSHDPRRRLHPADALLVLVRNLVLCREPLYAVGAWASCFDPSLFSLSAQQLPHLNDDGVGRALDQLFDCPERPSLLLAVATRAVREFRLRLDQFHTDSTSIMFHGQYIDARKGRPVRGLPTLRIVHGHSKDHRPDLRQLLWNLTVTSDGAVPVNYQALDGNTTDDQTHIPTWNVLRSIVGHPRFLYVADSKLCSRPNMAHIADRRGRFLTILPATRREDRRFRDWLQTHPDAPWQEVLHRENPEKTPDVFRAFEDRAGTSEGYRVVWYHSREKEKRDGQERGDKMDRAIRDLEKLRDRLAARRCRIRSLRKVHQLIQEILLQWEASRWLKATVKKEEEARYRQKRPGRPGEKTLFRRQVLRWRFHLEWEKNEEELSYDRKTDGIFPLVSNDRRLSEREMLMAYKVGQPRVEKRHHHLKGDHLVAPQYLKSVARIEAFLAVYFFALLVNGLIERQIRRAMKRRGMEALPLYPEGRDCRRPTTRQLLRVFEGLQVVRLKRGKGSREEVYEPELSWLQKEVLQMLGISPSTAYTI